MNTMKDMELIFFLPNFPARVLKSSSEKTVKWLKGSGDSILFCIWKSCVSGSIKFARNDG